MARVVFTLTDDQRDRWKVAAHGEVVSLAEWIRRACEARLAEDEAEDHAIEHAPEMIAARESADDELAAGTAKPLREVVAAIEVRPKGKCKDPRHGLARWKCKTCGEMF